MKARYKIYTIRNGAQYFVKKKGATGLELTNCPTYAKSFTEEMAQRILDAYNPEHNLKATLVR